MPEERLKTFYIHGKCHQAAKELAVVWGMTLTEVIEYAVALMIRETPSSPKDHAKGMTDQWR